MHSRESLRLSGRYWKQTFSSDYQNYSFLSLSYGGPSGLSKRREDVPDIPSWSWAAWDGIVDYPPLQTFDPTGQQMGSLIAIYSVNKRGELRRLKSNYHRFFESFDGPPSERPPGKSFAMRDRKEAMGIWSHRPRALEVWEQCPHNPSETLQRLEISAYIEEITRYFPGHLVFNTTKATLELEEPPWWRDSQSSPKKQSRELRVTLDLRNKNNNTIGIIMWMDKEWRKENISL
ncbi:hypothetical protein F5X96DRAFT_362321 [Biscogniauxia mediterranea]|nr:hypothetical protein F5X96DRAFT_362321 [Biscogniauxia mediterranea]